MCQISTADMCLRVWAQSNSTFLQFLGRQKAISNVHKLRLVKGGWQVCYFLTACNVFCRCPAVTARRSSSGLGRNCLVCGGGQHVRTAGAAAVAQDGGGSRLAPKSPLHLKRKHLLVCVRRPTV